MASKIKLSNANGKIVTIENNDSNMSDVTLNGASITKKVDTLADMRAMSELPETVWCSGYHTKNDGAFGSHFFRLKGLKTTETDNGGTIIIVSVGGSDYVYELQYSGAVNVRWFGAKGDGSDETTLIQSAFNSIGNSASLDFDDGVFGVNSSILISTFGNTITGTKGAKLKALSSFSGGIIKIENIGGLNFIGLRFDTIGFNTQCIAMVQTASVSNYTFDKCEFYSGGFSPFYYGASGYMASNLKILNCLFECYDVAGNTAIDVNYGDASFVDKDTFMPMVIDNNTFKGHSEAFWGKGTGVIYGTKFTNNIVKDSTSRALYWYHNSDSIVSGNIFDEYEDAVWFDGDCSVTNNIFTRSRKDGVLVYNSQCTFKNNTVKDSARDGVVISVATTDGSVSSNEIMKNGRYGIYVSALPRGSSWGADSLIYYVTVQGNWIAGNGADGIHLDDIKTDGTYGNSINCVSITGNTIVENGTLDTTSLNIYSGIKYKMYGTGTLYSKVNILGNIIADSYSLYAHSGNQYNAIVFDTPTSGTGQDINVIGNTLEAASAGQAYKDTKTYGNRNVVSNVIVGTITMAPFGNINKANNTYKNKLYTTTTSSGSLVSYNVSSIPSGGSVGDMAYASNPVASGVVGWIHTTTGWKTFGIIGA